jgi:hypothetical protein
MCGTFAAARRVCEIAWRPGGACSFIPGSAGRPFRALSGWSLRSQRENSGGNKGGAQLLLPDEAMSILLPLVVGIGPSPRWPA